MLIKKKIIWLITNVVSFRHVMVGLGVPRATHFNVTYPPSCALTRGSSGCRIIAGSPPYCGGVTPGRDVVVRGSSGAGSKQDVPQPLSQHFDSPGQSASVAHSCSHRVLLDTLGQRPSFVTARTREFGIWFHSRVDICEKKKRSGLRLRRIISILSLTAHSLDWQTLLYSVPSCVATNVMAQRVPSGQIFALQGSTQRQRSQSCESTYCSLPYGQRIMLHSSLASAHWSFVSFESTSISLLAVIMRCEKSKTFYPFQQGYKKTKKAADTYILFVHNLWYSLGCMIHIIHMYYTCIFI